MAQATTIAKWGNSEAVRIPKSILQALGLKSGDKVKVDTNEKGAIEITPAPREHRRVKPAKGITYESLFADYVYNPEDSRSPWPDHDMVGAEYEAWSH